MKVNIISIAYNLPLQTIRLFETAMQDADKHDISFQLFLHSKDLETISACEYLEANFPTKYYPYGENRGLSTSWNDGLLEAYGPLGSDVVIVANDDIYFSPGDIDKMAQKAAANREKYIVSVAGFHVGYGKPVVTHGYSCYALNPISMDVVGCFDENIFPVYSEDVEHHRRATLAGLVETNCADTMVYHGGSSSINHDPLLARQNIMTQHKNSQYVWAKWNSDSHHGGYKTPFNNPDFGLKIEPEVRHTPYGPDYDRTDRYIVRF